MTKKINPSLSSNHIKPTGKNFRARIVVWVLLVCIVTGVVFFIRQSRKVWSTIPPKKPVPVAQQDVCPGRLAQCQQENQQLTLRIQEAQKTRTLPRTFKLSMQLAQQLTAGQPFATTLAKLQSELPNQPELSTLSERLVGYAQQGVPTLAQLQQELEQIIQREARSTDHPKTQTWYAQVWQYVRTMITIRPTQFAQCTKDACRLYKAQQELKAQRLTAAIQTLNAVSDSASIAQLLEDMRARAFVTEYLTQFTSTEEIAQ